MSSKPSVWKTVSPVQENPGSPVTSPVVFPSLKKTGRVVGKPGFPTTTQRHNSSNHKGTKPRKPVRIDPSPIHDGSIRYLTRSDIKLSNQCVKCDSDEEFEMYQDNKVLRHYSETDRRNRGVVLQKGTGYVMCRTHGFVSQYFKDENEFEKETQKWLDSPAILFPSYDGSIVRLWNSPMSGKWYLSTSRKLDAYTSYYVSKDSLGLQFSRLLVDKSGLSYEAFCQQLDRQGVYTFLLTKPPSANVGENPPPQELYSLGWFDRANQFAFHYGEIHGVGIIPSVPIIHRNPASIAHYVETLSEENQYVMGVTFLHRETGEMCKITSLRHKEIKQIRGTSPNLLVGYILSPNQEEYRKLYVKDARAFDVIDRELQVFINLLLLEFNRIQEHHIIINSCPHYEGILKYSLKILCTMHKNDKFETLDQAIIKEHIHSQIHCPSDAPKMEIPRYALDLIRYLSKKGKLELGSLLSTK